MLTCPQMGKHYCQGEACEEYSVSASFSKNHVDATATMTRGTCVPVARRTPWSVMAVERRGKCTLIHTVSKMVVNCIDACIIACGWIV